jgi:hypothetical protein
MTLRVDFAKIGTMPRAEFLGERTRAIVAKVNLVRSTEFRRMRDRASDCASIPRDVSTARLELAGVEEPLCVQGINLDSSREELWTKASLYCTQNGILTRRDLWNHSQIMHHVLCARGFLLDVLGIWVPQGPAKKKSTNIARQEVSLDTFSQMGSSRFYTVVSAVCAQNEIYSESEMRALSVILYTAFRTKSQKQPPSPDVVEHLFQNPPEKAILNLDDHQLLAIARTNMAAYGIRTKSEFAKRFSFVYHLYRSKKLLDVLFPEFPDDPMSSIIDAIKEF